VVANWYRQVTWSTQAETDFFARLNRCRAFNRPQYVRIQAHYLEETGDPALVRAALRLLDIMLERWPEPLQLAAAYHQRATCFMRLGEPFRAVENFRQAIHTERIYPNASSGAAIDFAWLVGTCRLTPHYAEALAVLDGAGALAFPVERFKAFGARAFILTAMGRKDDAVLPASQALDAARATDSGFRFHRTVGLVGEQYADMAEQLRELAAAEQRDEADEARDG
jgi:tetratricopeptide (TPR) repeat protein